MSDDGLPEFDLHELMHEYGLGTVRNVCKAKGGAVNENWIVRTATETVVVRAVAKEHSRKDIQFEHSFIRALGRDGFPYHLPRPLRSRTGRTVAVRNGVHVWLYNYIEGSSSQPSQGEGIAQIAHAMATAHKLARRFSLRPVKKTPCALEDMWLVRALRHWQLKVIGSLDQRYRFFSARVQECISILEQNRCTCYGALPRLPIHGDMCRQNVVFSGGRVKGVIDFDHCCLDTAIRDITIALGYECTNPKHCFELDLHAARHFLRVYSEVNPLSAEEVNLIPGVAMAESADLFWWRIFQVADKQNDVPSVREVEQPFKSLRWYNDHQKEVARALRA